MRGKSPLIGVSAVLTMPRFLQRLEFTGFSREKQISFPHKQSWYVRLRREQWDGPAL
jgi:hypothetical protein